MGESDEGPSAEGRTAARNATDFRRAVGATGAAYLELPDWGEVALHAREHGGRVAVTPSLDGRHPGLRAALVALGIEVVIPDGDDPAAQVADVPVGVAAGELGVAETGSVLVAEHHLTDRVVTMLCDRLVLVLDRSSIADRLEDAARWLSEAKGRAGFASLITGPSRTADIERSLTIGVQGPQEVDVVVLG